MHLVSIGLIVKYVIDKGWSGEAVPTSQWPEIGFVAVNEIIQKAFLLTYSFIAQDKKELFCSSFRVVWTVMNQFWVLEVRFLNFQELLFISVDMIYVSGKKNNCKSVISLTKLLLSY